MIEEFIFYNQWTMYLAIGLFSVCVGSLLNVVIYRLPLMLKYEWQEECYELLAIEPKEQLKKINLFLPRSFCPQCHTIVKAWQNIPLISYVLLRGACHQCKTTIPLKYPLVELITMMLSLFAYWHFGFNPKLVFALLALWLLIPLFFIDLEHQLLPDNLTLSLLWLGLIANTQSLFTHLNDAVLSAAAAYLALWIVIKVFYLITGKIGMGNGDFKLFAAFGAWFGWMSLPLILLFSSISGTVVGIIYLKSNNKTKETTIPFGPFLCTSGIIYLFYGPQIMHWYLSILL